MDAHTRTAMIAGAAGNLGRCVADSFHAAGANLVLADLRLQSLKKAFGAEGERRLYAPANLLEPVQVNGAARAAIDRFGRIDVVCNLANINVNCVLPTTIDTPENRAAMPDADLARWVAPDSLARVVFFLASDDACAIHGAALPVTALN